MKRIRPCLIAALCLCAAGVLLAADFNPDVIKKRVSEFTLVNGMKFILLEDHSVPIANFVTYANVGSNEERIGIYGISHIIEHLAFKGTSEVGTTDAKAEKAVMDQMDAVFDQILAEKGQVRPDPQRLESLNKELAALQEKAGSFIVTNEFDSIVKRNGGLETNAGTSKDSTVYYLNLPSNKLELWAYLESSRFSDPVFREFYKEKNVIMEERRMRTENSPFGKLLEEMVAVAFKDHPYHISNVGPMSNLEHISMADVKGYFADNYGAANLIVGVAGDVTPAQLKKYAEKYFAKLPAGRRIPRLFTIDPPQVGGRTVTVADDSQPGVILAYHCPCILDKDFETFQLVNYILTNGRTSRLNNRMTIQDKSALAVFSFIGYPGSKYPSLYMIAAIPNSGRTNAECEKVVLEEVEKLKKDLVTEEELASGKIRYKVDMFGQLESNNGLLQNMLVYEAQTGSWTNYLDHLAAVDKITAQDVQNVFKKYFKASNLTVAKLEKLSEGK